MIRSHRPASDWLLLGLLVSMWGSSFAFTKIALGGLPPASMVAVRLSIGAAALTTGMLLAGFRLPSDRRSWLWFAVMAVIGNAAPFFLIGWGQQQIDSGLAGILMAVMPLMTLVLAHVFVPGERLTGVRLAGFGLGFVGVVVLLGPDIRLHVSTDPESLAAKLAVLGGALCYGINAILARRRPANPPVIAATGVVIIASLVMAPTALVVDGPLSVIVPRQVALALGFLGVISTALATVVYFRWLCSQRLCTVIDSR